MGVGYILVNQTKHEQVIFAHVSANTKRELAGHPAASAITTCYLLENPGNHIAFVSDTYGDWPFAEGSRADLEHYREVTTEVVQSLIEAGILVDDGKECSPGEESAVFNRRLRNVWMDDGPP